MARILSGDVDNEFAFGTVDDLLEEIGLSGKGRAAGHVGDAGVTQGADKQKAKDG
ncbi:MAG: hypothetical protein GY759_04220 [Chloroflexi bacterium]|nr:hypothetical protein [Chloroflexota bacterium]